MILRLNLNLRLLTSTMVNDIQNQLTIAMHLNFVRYALFILKDMRMGF